jgi:Flp pilus assembly pilin Flp
MLLSWYVRARYVRARSRLSEEAGQTTAEYALVILAAAAVAVVLIAWARS